ncbi:MAG: sulfate ABC transporter substrate-binding protein [Syntrophales bacterium]|jgi:sulfate transport system substrate-binding protein|nr:sulfate ABC transporter substrate-binding protein [Syntrophales bacterium]
MIAGTCRYVAVLVVMLFSPLNAFGGTVELLNASYDPTRELYREFNDAFASHWHEKTGNTVVVRQSHGGSGSQARSVIQGLQADVVTLALAADIDAIAEHSGLLPSNWQTRFPHNSAPYSSTLAFLVRKGNPKNIHNWDDLAREDVQVITPNPKTSGVARWNYLAIWGFALRRELGENFVARLKDPLDAEEVAAAQEKARDFTARVYRNVPVLDRAARGATNTFIQRKLGDVLINWENEALLGANELDAARVEIVVPPVAIKTEPVVALVDVNVDRKKTREIAQAYLEFLYSPTGQDIAARNYYRPVDPAVFARYAHQFPELELFTVDEVFGGWPNAYRDHFDDGASFDRIYSPR